MLPVGGVIWRPDQVKRLALVAGDRRSETGFRGAIAEALAAARTDPVRRILRAIDGRGCHPQDVAFLTASGWVPVRISCPGGFFLDYLPRPELKRP